MAVVVHEPSKGERFEVEAVASEVQSERKYRVSGDYHGVRLSGLLTLVLAGTIVRNPRGEDVGEYDGYNWLSDAGFADPDEDLMQVVLDLFSDEF